MIDAIAIARTSGQAAIALLFVTLFAGLHPKTKPKRRTLGLMTFALASIHALYAIASPLVEDLSHLVYEPHLRAGATTLAIFVVLAATSFPLLFKVPEWKALHRLIYAAMLLAFLHVVLSPHASRVEILAVAWALTAVLFSRAVRWTRYLRNISAS